MEFTFPQQSPGSRLVSWGERAKGATWRAAPNCPGQVSRDTRDFCLPSVKSWVDAERIAHLPAGVLFDLDVLSAGGQQALDLQHIACARVGQRLQHHLPVL